MPQTGKCAKEIEKYCEDVEEGEGKLADCMSDAITQSENPDNEDGKAAGGLTDPVHQWAYIHSSADFFFTETPDITDDCREEVYSFNISRNANINRNIPLGELSVWLYG